MSGLAQRLKELREGKGLSQYELARLLQLPRPTYAGYERGIREPDVALLVKFSEFYDCSVGYLLGATDDPHDEGEGRDVGDIILQTSPLRLRELRNDRGLSRKDLAELTGIPVEVIDEYENGDSAPAGDNLSSLARALGVDSGYIIGMTNTPILTDPMGQADPSVARELPDKYDPTDPKTRLIAFLRGSEITPEDEETIRAYLRVRKAEREAQKRS